MQKFPFLFLIGFSLFLLFISGCEKDSPSQISAPDQGKILLVTVPDSAEIFINQISSSKFTPDTITANIGNQVITLKKPGYLDSTFTAQIIKNESIYKEVYLTPGARGGIRITSEPSDAQITYENWGWERTPVTINNLLPTTFKFKVSLTGYVDTLVEAIIYSNQIILKHVVLTRKSYGNVYLTSAPAGALIFQGHSYANKITPDTVKNLDTGSVFFTLKLTDYKDTTFTVVVIANKTITKSITMTERITPLVIQTFNDIQLYERTSSVGFSAVVLATGEKVFSSAVTADLFYDVTEVKSQHLRTPAPATLRYTDFYNGGSGTDIDDGVDAPAYSATSGAWTYSKAISINTYSFLYTNDSKYVKFIITARGGGTGPSDEYKWVKVSYKINQTAGDRRF